MALVGIVVGSLAGLLSAIRMAMAAASDPKPDEQERKRGRKGKFRQTIMTRRNPAICRT